MEKLRAIVDETMGKLEGIMPADQTDKVAKVIEAAIIRGMLEGQHRAIDACNECGGAEQATVRRIATAIRAKNDVLIVNLSSLR